MAPLTLGTDTGFRVPHVRGVRDNAVALGVRARDRRVNHCLIVVGSRHDTAPCGSSSQAFDSMR